MRRGPAELTLVWSVYAVFAAAVAVTYARLPPAELYHVSEDGVDGGLGRALVFANFPVALAAAAVLVFLADRLRDLRTVAWLGFGLCWVTAVPGVVDQADLDAKAANAVPAAGVAIAVALSAVLVAREGRASLRPALPGDRLRLAAAALLLLAGIPWLFAEAGFYADEVPVLADVFMSDELAVDDEGRPIRAVHLGEHHGTDGMLLALTAIVLSRLVGAIHSPRLRAAFAAYLALMLAYGLWNAAQDGWLEQVVKRGWTDARIPDALQPEPTAAWALLLVLAALAYVALLRPRGD